MINMYTRPHSAVSSEFDCRSRDCEFDPGSHTFVKIDHEIFSKVIFLLRMIQEGLLSVTSEGMCMNYQLTT